MSQGRAAALFFRAGALFSHLTLFPALGLWLSDPLSKAEIPGLSEALSTTVETGNVIRVLAPPSATRDADKTTNSVALVRSEVEAFKGPGSDYETISSKYLTVQNPNASLREIGALVKHRYRDVVLSRVDTPAVTRILVEPMTLVYPTDYYENTSPVRVHLRRLTLEAPDRKLVAYYANYDKLSEHHQSVIFHINGHFGANPSRMGFGLEQLGGVAGAALGKIAMQGYPLVTYDDHNVGESSGASDSLPQVLENIQMMDRTLLTKFARVDAVGISGGAERLYHTMAIFQSKIRSVYYAGFAVPQWTRLTGAPFGSDHDTHDKAFLESFQFADLVLVGLARGVKTAFAHNAYEGGRSKYGYFVEIAPTLQRYTSEFVARGDDRNGDGVPDSGPGLAHEYDLPDYLEFLNEARAVSEVGL
jgi:hypothetical protein